jgi:phosphoribosylformylglycinamidine synthase
LPQANPNGSVDAIAGVANRSGTVVGLMPHPERATERLLGSEDGRLIFESLARWLGARHQTRRAPAASAARAE